MKFVTRSGWGARDPRSVTALPASKLDTVVFHYTASDHDEQADHSNCASRVRGIQTFHMVSRGWNDIAYNFIVCKHGYVFEGRGFGVMSAATAGHNSHTIAICFLGDDTENRDDVTNAGRQGLVDAANHILRLANKALRFGGHREFVSTSCPGDEIFGFIKSDRFKQLVAEGAKLWPIPIPSWFWAWVKWRRSGRKGPRPALAPAKIPDWAWRRIKAMGG